MGLCCVCVMRIVVLMAIFQFPFSLQSDERSEFPQELKPCKKYGDTYGSWHALGNKDLNGTNHPQQNNLTRLEAHFNDKFTGGAENFTNIWLPRGCSYHRFTADEIHLRSNITRQMDSARNESTVNYLELVFLGDSALRGILCGITRILAGNEIAGPNENKICGGTQSNDGVPISLESVGSLFSVDYQNLRITFGYIKTLRDKHFRESWHKTLGRKPYAVVVNTGAWDFDDMARPHFHDKVRWDKGSEYCSSNESLAVSSLRSNRDANKTIWEMSNGAKASGIRLIYRNNHHNNRFGCYCADVRFEALLSGTNWEVWDNTRISEETWVKQSYDGFHFDRTFVHTVDSHWVQRQTMLSKGLEYAGQLEMQLAHSLLNALFHHTFRKHSSPKARINSTH